MTWRPRTCPHQVATIFPERGLVRCQCRPWPICSPETCPIDFGPWGAWRAVLDQLVPLLAKMDRPFVIDETTTDEQMEAWYDTRLMWSERLLALGRLGWSP